MRIITNHHKRFAMYGNELPAKEHDWWASLLSDIDEQEFLFYKGNYMPVCDFMYIDRNAPQEFQGWDGYSSDTYFSGILVKYDSEDDIWIVATYIS